MKKIIIKDSINKFVNEEWFIDKVFVELEKLHERKIIHGDFNANNILVDENLDIHIIDFGRSRFAESEFEKDFQYFIWCCLMYLSNVNVRYYSLWLKYCPDMVFKKMDIQEFREFIDYDVTD
jgi:tRNA A-37 threonylcarbamoyl transferase component Bud32